MDPLGDMSSFGLHGNQQEFTTPIQSQWLGTIEGMIDVPDDFDWVSRKIPANVQAVDCNPSLLPCSRIRGFDG